MGLVSFHYNYYMQISIEKHSNHLFGTKNISKNALEITFASESAFILI